MYAKLLNHYGADNLVRLLYPIKLGKMFGFDIFHSLNSSVSQDNFSSISSTVD